MWNKNNMAKMISLFVVFLFMAAPFLSSCGLLKKAGGGSSSSSILVSIAVTPTNPTLALATAEQFTATGTFSDNSTQDITSSVTWSSSNASIATVASNGKVVAVSTGTTTITATSGTFSGSTSLTVTSATLVSIAITPTNPAIALATTEQFTATGTFSDNSTQDITLSVIWSSSNAPVATISNTAGSNGKVTPLSPGTTTITATSGNISVSTILTITSATLVSIAVTPANPAIALKTTEQFTATGTFSDKSTQDITASATWSSSNASVATISNTAGSNGKATLLSEGTTTITATSVNISASTILTVTSATLVSIAVTPANPAIALKTTEQFTATGTFSDKSTQDVTASATWSSSNASVATISNMAGSNGKATPLSAGTTTITAASGSISGSTPLTVTAATLVSIAVTSTSPGIALGTTEQFTATGTFSDKSTQDITASVTWISSNASVATISNTAASIGQVTAVSTGTTTITAASGSISGSASLAVTSEPYITAAVFSLAGGSNPLGWLQQIQVYTDSLSYTPITNATVTVNGSPLSYTATNQSYDGNVVIAAGAAINLSITIGGATYAASGTQYTTFPSVTVPASGSTWQAANANTIAWTIGAPTAGATYVVGLMDSTGNFVYPGKNPINVPTSSTSYPVPANSLTAGNYELLVGIGTQGIGGEKTGGISIPNTAVGSGLWVGGITAFVPITVR